MVFSSISFLFFFLPVFLLLYYLLNGKSKWQFSLLFFSSLLFYFWGESFLVWILLTSTTIDYLVSHQISGELKSADKNTPGSLRRRKIWLAVSIISNLAFLGYFKYFNFFADNIIFFIRALGYSHIIPENIVRITLPLGISFYTFQSMSYTIDVYREKVKATRSFLKFASYVTMFPQLVAGPIVRFSDIEEQINNHRVRLDDFVEGMKRFITGLAKKVLIANTLAGVADQIFALPSGELSTGMAWLGITSYSLQLYFDFSGYSCMAIGIGRMLGFRFPENFNFPYIARSISEFWQRWHITLSTWFRDYLYFPLGGSRKGNLITYRNLFVVFVTCGLWHGSSWNYLVWGLSHGVFMILEKVPALQRLGKLPRIFHHIYMLVVFNLTLAIFRVETIPGAIDFLKALLGFAPIAGNWHSLRELLQNHVLIVFLAAIIFSTPLIKNAGNYLQSHMVAFSKGLRISYLLILTGLFILSALSLASGTYNPFIYFRF